MSLRGAIDCACIIPTIKHALMRRAKHLLWLCFFLPISHWAMAGNTLGAEGQSRPEFSINGFVTDASSKKPVQGVTVSISNDNLKEKREYKTDAAGNFKARSLPSGGVTIVLEKKGYKTVRKEGVMIREGETLRLDLDIDPDNNAEEVFHPFLRVMEGI